jgi:hypothetical protein
MQLELAFETPLPGLQAQATLLQSQRQRADREIAAITPQPQATRSARPFARRLPKRRRRAAADLPVAVDAQRIAIALERGQRADPFREIRRASRPPASADCRHSASVAARKTGARAAATSRRRRTRRAGAAAVGRQLQRHRCGKAEERLVRREASVNSLSVPAHSGPADGAARPPSSSRRRSRLPARLSWPRRRCRLRTPFDVEGQVTQQRFWPSGRSNPASCSLPATTP